MRRLFSTFAGGAPGTGLLLMRLTAGAALAARAVTALVAGTALGVGALHGLALLDAVLLVVGLWTPIAGVLAALMAGWGAIANPADARFEALVAVIGLALALLGPGAWSIDARLFGWKRVEIRNGKGGGKPPI